ncbi:DUF4007 family protein [Candidatus Viridilinea mediisalina]|uniref:DUF4007 domain-containing protein n=1 Tax=Candidatus Viridilinea mediisalina TaxID=2024553 RepID=A0A2A6RLW5_9CHLR|nr:DUF4007 family protein [Candidatus Viridilinea mediisalina]PDW03840.1 hypothetical protein CJ255_06715 [Candidatus Viridilinea mediisalina]
MQPSALSASSPTLSFSGHETFVLRGNWLKKAYDLLLTTPDLFTRKDAFVLLGVGKNMANSIRFWGRVCGVFAREAQSHHYCPTELGHALLADDGWDPFLVTPAARWLLHWQLCSRPETAFSWYFTFNRLRRGEFTAHQLTTQLMDHVQSLGLRPPSTATLGRDVDCLLRCYLRPQLDQKSASLEDVLQCPLHELELIQRIPGQASLRLTTGTRPDLPDALVAFAALHQARHAGRAALAFNELAYGERSPGRIFRLDEEALLHMLLRLETLCPGRVAYAEQGGVRQLLWRDHNDSSLEQHLLQMMFG